MPNLADFREQYPQYNNTDDEVLADALYKRYYADSMDVDTFRDSIGLAPIEKPPEPPTVWDRVKSVFNQKEQKPAAILDNKQPDSEAFEFEDTKAKPAEPARTLSKTLRGRRAPGVEVPQPEDVEPEQPRARLRDQLFAGFDEMRANRATIDAFDAARDLGDAEKIARGQINEGGLPSTGATASELDRKILDARSKYGDDKQKTEALSVIESNAARIRGEQITRLQAAIDKSKDLRARASQIPFAKETREMLEAETFQEGIAEFADDPIMIIAETSLRSLPNMAEALPLAVGGAIVAGPMGFMAGMGTGAGMTEYRAAFSSYLQDNGVNIDNASELLDASQSDDLMRRAHDFALKRSQIIGGVSAIGGGLSTKPLTPFVKNAVGRELSNVGAQTVLQAGLEGSGEALAQIATTGEVEPGEVLAEVTGSLSQAPIEVGVASVTGVRANAVEKQIRKIEQEVEQILGDRVHGDYDIDKATEGTVPTHIKVPDDLPKNERAEYQLAIDKGLDISEEARISRARDMGFDVGIVFEHDTNYKFGDSDEIITEILEGEDNTVFDGIFTIGQRYYENGDFLPNSFFVKKRLEHEEFKNIFYSDIEKSDELLLEDIPDYDDLSDSQKEIIRELVTEERDNLHQLADEAAVLPEWINNLFPYQSEDIGRLEWEIQRVRGALAKNFGADAVDMYDETGISTLLLATNNVRSIYAAFDPVKSDSVQLLDSRVPRETTPPDIEAKKEDIHETRTERAIHTVDQPADPDQAKILNAIKREADVDQSIDFEMTEELQEVDNEYQEGDLLAAELIEALQDLEDLPIELEDAIEKYFSEVQEDFAKWGGRGDVEGYENDFIAEYERVIKLIEDQETDTPTVLASKMPPKMGKPDRRQDAQAVDTDRRRAERRSKVERMSLDELVDAYYTDPLTGLGNRTAFTEEVADMDHVASIDADSLKWINDNLGHDAGDAMLMAIGESLQQSDVTAYRLGGDEFYIAGNTRESVEGAVTLAEGVLSNQVINSPLGQKVGIEITAGIGQNKAEADSKMEATKKTKKGKAARGAAPASGVTLKSAKPLNMQPGTNYVPIIGNTGALPIDANHNLILQTTGKPLRIPKTPVRRDHVLALMQKYFGKRIYQGRVKGKNVGGFYRPGQGEVRLKKHNDIEVAAHEIAHFLDDRYPWIKRLYLQHSDEVKSVSYDQTLIYEGWAEFMRLWMTQETEAMTRTPAFYDAFNTEAKKQPQLWNALIDLQELMHAWTMQGARARAASKHGATIATFFEKVRALFPVNIYQRTLDGLRSIKVIAADLSDHDQPAVIDAYERLRLALGGSNGVIEAAMFHGSPQWRADGQGIELGGESLMDIWGDDWGNEEVAMYMIARRAKEMMEQNRENLMRADEIAAWLDLENQRPELVDKFRRHQEFNQRLLDFAEAGGILGNATREAFVAMNQNYVPFHRVVESRINGTKVQSGGNPFMRLSGGTQNINNIWDNIVNNAGLIIRMSMVNDGKRALLRKLGQSGPLGGTTLNQQAGIYASPIAKDTKPVKVHSEQVLRQLVDAMGLTWKQYRTASDTGMYPAGPEGEQMEAMVNMIDRMADGMEEMATFWQFNQDPKGDNLDFYMEDGEKQFFEINDPNLMDSLRFLGPRGTNLVIAIAGAFSATLRRGVVAVPVFQIKNFIRDTTNAWLLSSHVKVPAVRAMKVVFSRMNKDPAYVDMLLNGGGFANRSQGLQAQRKLIIDPTKLAAFYDRFMGRFENANRLAEYKAAIEAGETPRRAALLSREISTDFAMRGSSDVARYLAISVPFLNARVQGLYRVKRQFDLGETAVSYAVRGLALAGATAALYMLNKDDERYKELPEDIKDLYYVFFTGDAEDDYVLMPKAFESGMLFSTLPERMMEYAEQENGKEFADALGWMFLSTFHMDMTPQIFQPWQDLARNKNFADSPIIPYYLENVEPSEQYTYYTSEAVKAAAQAMGMSPIKTEHVLRGYLGTLGTYAIGAADAMIRASTEPEDRQFGADPTRGETWKENILVKGLIDPLVNEGPPRRTKYVTDLYNMLRESQKVANTVVLHQNRNIEKVEGYLNEPGNLVQFATNEPLNNARKQLNEIRTNMDKIRQSKEMTGDEKRVQLWELRRQRNKVARDAVLAIQAAQQQEEERLQAANEK